MKSGVIAVLVVLLAPAVSFSAGGINEGLWQVTTKMEMPGMPMEMPPTVMNHCYTKSDVQDNKKIISRDENCTVTDLKASGSKVSWKMKCTGENAATMTGETIFSGNSYTSTMKMNAQGQNMTMKVRGKRLGDCE